MALRGNDLQTRPSFEKVQSPAALSTANILNSPEAKSLKRQTALSKKIGHSRRPGRLRQSFVPVYRREAKHRDGYVSLGSLAVPPPTNTNGTPRRRPTASGKSRSTVPNVMIKVPATPEGVPAIPPRPSRGRPEHQHHPALSRSPPMKKFAEAFIRRSSKPVAAKGQADQHTSPRRRQLLSSGRN